MRIHRLGHKIVCAGVDPLNLVLALMERRDQHDRRQSCGLVLLDAIADLETAELGHQHVHEHKIGMLPIHHVERLLAIGCGDHGVTFAGQERFQQLDVRRHVIDDEHFAGRTDRIAHSVAPEGTETRRNATMCLQRPS